MKKKILFVTKALWIGGIETALVNLLNHFDYEKHDVTLLVLHAELDMLDRIHPNCRVLIADRERSVTFEKAYQYRRLYHLTEDSANPSRLHRMMMWMVPATRWVENRLYIRYIREQMRNEHFDTAIIYSDVAAETAIRAINADKFLMFYHHGAMRHVYHDEIAYKKCEKIIAVSQNQADALKAFVPSAAEKIMVIHNLTDVDGIRAKAEQPIDDVFDKSKFNIVSVGRVSHEKGMDIAVHACAKLVQDGHDDVCWWIVGDGPAMPEVQEAIRETGMQGHVITVGMKPNPHPYIRQADLYVQPSRFESYGLTIAEALVLEKKVISTDTAGAREILTGKKNTVLCRSDAEHIAEAVEKNIKGKSVEAVKYSEVFRKENGKLLRELELIL